MSKSHYQRVLEARTELSEVTEDIEQSMLNKISQEYDEAASARLTCAILMLLSIFGSGFILGGMFGKNFLTWLNAVI